MGNVSQICSTVRVKMLGVFVHQLLFVIVMGSRRFPVALTPQPSQPPLRLHHESSGRGRKPSGQAAGSWG